MSEHTPVLPHQETAPLAAITIHGWHDEFSSPLPALKDALTAKSFLMARLPGTPDTHEVLRVVALTDAWEILDAAERTNR